MKLIAVLLLSMIMVSCRIETPAYVTVRIAEEHPFEDMMRNDMWHTLIYFDGRDIIREHVPWGVREVSIRVYSGGLRPVVMVPIDVLGPIGGFFEGNGDTVILRAEDGSFAEMLIRAAEYRPDAVSMLSMENVRKAQPYLADIDESAFLEGLYNGTLSSSSIKSFESKPLMFELIPSGTWISERYDVPSFDVEFSGQTVYLSFRPGVYRFGCLARSLLLTIAVDEEFETTEYISVFPSW